ncbi:hypothetical protein MRX96_007592 [Rhipicephalus microplus]
MIAHIVIGSRDDDTRVAARRPRDIKRRAGKGPAEPRELGETRVNGTFLAQKLGQLAYRSNKAGNLLMLSMNRGRQQRVLRVLARFLIGRPMPENETATESATKSATESVTEPARILVSTWCLSAANLMRLRCSN